MPTPKTFWLASAALLAPIAALAPLAAHAADLPFRKAAPADYVRICDAFGAGFFYIPGNDTCLRISGQLRAENTFRVNAPLGNPAAYAYNLAGQTYRRDLTNFRARGYLNADARTQTAYGTLRAYVSIRITQDTTNSGPLGGGREPAAVQAAAGRKYAESTGFFQGLAPGAAPVLDKGFIQFAGFTAGRAQSFFDFDAQSYELINNSVANSNEVTELFAYTATFGAGFSATVSVENSIERSTGDIGLYNLGATVGGVTSYSTQNPTVVAAGARAGYLAYAGEQIPDVVANLRYDGAWGSAQLSGAYHELRSLPVAFGPGIAGVAAGTVFNPATESGFAVQGGVKVLLPSLAKGDSLTLQGVYQEGAMDYANSNNYFNGLTNIFTNSVSIGVPVNDAFVNTQGKIVKSAAYGGYAAIRHYWVPDVYSSLYGAFLQIDNPTSAQLLGAGADNARVFQIGFNTIWTPVKDFQIGGEVLYSNLLLTGRTVLPENAPEGNAVRNPDDYRARLSLRRAF